jgi:hypothetical protein
MRFAAQFVPEDEVLRVVFYDTTKKKAGTHIEGLDRYRAKTPCAVSLPQSVSPGYPH